MIILSSPGEIAFQVGNFPIYYYGIIIALATIIGFCTSYQITKYCYKDIDTDSLYDLATVIIISGIVCARIYYCLLNQGYYINHIDEIINIRQGGLAIHGAILGGLVFGSVYCFYKKYPILKMADIVSYGLIIAQAVGRWGNFFNSEAYGLPARHFIGVFIPENARIVGYEFYKYFHPTFLYESILNIFIFLILFFVIRKLKYKFDGLIFMSYLILYSVVRFFVEALRLDSIANVGTLHAPQIASILIIILASSFIIYKNQTQH